jgi:hypothetical protein
VLDQLVSKVATQQHGLVTWRQAMELGCTPKAVEVRVISGRWIAVHEGVYRIAGAPVTYAQRLLAACLAIGPEAAASHRAAATLHGLITPQDPPIEVSTTRARSPQVNGAIVHRLADLSRRWVDEVNGVPCTTVARTLVDLGAVCHEKVVQRSLDRAIGRRLVTLLDARAALVSVARRGRRGVGVLRRLLEARGVDVQTVGVLAERMLTLLRTHDVPMPEVEYTVTDRHGGFIARVDFAYPDAKLALEVVGYEFHVPLRQFRHDRKRARALIALGWTILEFTWDEVDALSATAANEIKRELRRLRAAA